MKQINYTGSSKLIARIIDLLNKKAPLPLNQQGEVDWGTDGKVLGTDGVGGTKWVDPGSGGGDVTDVEVNGTSVVNAQGVAEVSVPTQTSDLNNDSDFVSDASYVHTDNNYTNADSAKLSGIASGAEVNVQSDWNEADSTSDAYIANKPTIPTVNDGTLTIQQNGTTVGTFSANQSGDTTVNLTGGGGSGGHTIENTSGTDLPQEDNLQFVGVYTRDDSVNSRTEVNIVRQMTKAQMQALSSAEQEGFIDTTDEDDDYIPIAAEDVKRGVSDVDADLTALENGKVNRSGDTMTGALAVNRSDSNVPLTVQGNASAYTWIQFKDKNGNVLGNIGVNSSNKPCFFVNGGFLGEILLAGGARTATTLLNEAANIAASGNKTYSALTATALQAYDEIHFLANFGNVFVNGTATKEQMQNITAYTSPANGRLWFFAASLSASTEYSFRIRADSNGLQIINGSASVTLNNLRIDGIKYN